MIRFLIVATFVILFLILSIPVFLIEWIIGKFNPRARDISALRIVQGAFKIVAFLSGVKLTVIGEQHVPKDQAVLYIGNHRSFFDIVLTYARCPDLTGYIAKKEILHVPLLSRWMKFLYCLFLDRTDLKAGLKTILTAIDYVKSGISIMIFPEGTRVSEDEAISAKGGLSMLSVRTNSPIVPVYLDGGKKFFRRTCIVFGEPYHPQVAGRRGTAEEYQQIADEALRRIYTLKQERKV